MKILGLLNLNQDSAASLMIDGKLVCLAEEERFVRKKHAKGYFPKNAINYCLKSRHLTLPEIDLITIGWDVFAYETRMRKYFEETSSQYSKDKKSIEWEINQLKKYDPEKYISELKSQFIESGWNVYEIPTIKFYSHHYSHALTAFLPSKFENAIILTMDGHGEENCVVVWRGESDRLQKLKEINIPHSLGWFYAAATKFCGFSPNDGEGKTMGLAPYGKPNKSISANIRKVISIENNGYKINPEYLFYGDRTFTNEFTDHFVSLFGLPRDKDRSVFEENYADFAYEAQLALEDTVSNLVRETISKTNVRNVCLAGGVALNCKMNGVIASLPEVENIYVQPVSSDVGTTFGSSLALIAEQKDMKYEFSMEHIYLGPEFTNDEIEDALKKRVLGYEYYAEVEKEAAQLIAEGKVIGWFQGRMEAGPRALGNRSILGDPRNPEMKDIINNKVKFREPWRPFCPSILEEYQNEYIENSFNSPYMIIAFKVKADMVGKIPAVVHIDNTARIQSVSKRTNLRYWNLIEEFRKTTEVPVVLNTSFNIKGEPIVCTPDEAIETFNKTEMDVLVMGNFIIKK